MSTTLHFGLEPFERALDDIRRYCGLPWSGGPPEVFAYRYFDALPERREDDEVRPVDVLAAGALHPGLTKADLTYFVEARHQLREELAALPTGVDLGDAPREVVHRVLTLGERVQPACGLSLLTKVLHHKRPRLVPMLDRTLTDTYRRFSGERGAKAWRPCVGLLQRDLAFEENRKALSEIQRMLASELDAAPPSQLRLADIAIWMGSSNR